MNNILNVVISENNEAFAHTNFLEIDSNTTNLSRKFFFHNISFNKSIDLLEVEKIMIDISYTNKDGEEFFLYSFEILLRKFGYPDSDSEHFWVYGKIKPTDAPTDYYLLYDYRQGAIDIFNLWQKGKDIEWSSLKPFSYLKAEYMQACRMFSGFEKKMKPQSTFFIDMNLIKEKNDFYYYAGLELLGNRCYIGWGLDAFDDCLLTIGHKSGFFHNKTVVFKNVASINCDMLEFYEEIKEILSKNEFNIQEM